MRIAYVYDAVYPFVKGGIERRVYEIGRRLARKHEVHWFGMDWGGEPEGMIFHPVGRWENLYSGGRRSVREAAYFAVKLLLKFRDEYDLIDCQQFPYLSCFSMRFHSSLKKIPLVVTWHEFWGEYWLEYLGKSGIVGMSIEDAMKGLGDVNVSVSKLTWKALVENGINSTLIPNGIDYGTIQKVPPDEEEYDVAFVGRLIPEKNVPLLLEALAALKKEIRDIKAVIIGDGPERKSLEARCKRLGLERNVVFKGFLESNDAVISHIKASKVFVLPSRREGFGIVALEANAAGIPVVTLDYPLNAAKELIIPGYNGLVSKPSRDALVEAILRTIENHRKMKGNCIKNAKKYDWDRIARLTEEFYERVLNER
ncbi:glycosyltransferase family 1 protein [Thermococcus sp. MV11]|nr:glycosyltransferase family 1 protein [Thermococcus sp. MV11]